MLLQPRDGLLPERLPETLAEKAEVADPRFVDGARDDVLMSHGGAGILPQHTEIEDSPKVKHLRTTNPIESTFATVQHRTRQTKGCGSRQATLTMVCKLGREAEKHWRRLDGSRLIVKVLHGVRFIDGEEHADDRRAA